MYPAWALGRLGWAPTDLCNRVQQGAATEDGWIDSFCNVHFLRGHSTSEIDYRAFHSLMTFFCIKWRKSSRQSWSRTAAPPRWEEPEEAARMCGQEASLVWCSWNVAMGRVHPEEDLGHAGKTVSLFQLGPARYFYPLLVWTIGHVECCYKPTPKFRVTPSCFWLQILSDFSNSSKMAVLGKWYVLINFSSHLKKCLRVKNASLKCFGASFNPLVLLRRPQPCVWAISHTNRLCLLSRRGKYKCNSLRQNCSLVW